MIANCAGGFDPFGLSEAGFFRDLLTISKLVIPAALGFLLWRLHLTRRLNARQSSSVLGLAEVAAETPATRFWSLRFSPLPVLLSLMIAVLTFELGLLSVFAHEFVHNIFDHLRG